MPGRERVHDAAVPQMSRISFMMDCKDILLYMIYFSTVYESL